MLETKAISDQINIGYAIVYNDLDIFGGKSLFGWGLANQKLLFCDAVWSNADFSTQYFDQSWFWESLKVWLEAIRLKNLIRHGLKHTSNAK